jgi:hypothetical protein
MMSGFMKCRLTRITDNGHTRTKVIEGETYATPKIGQVFEMTAPPLDPTAGATERLVWTTPVKSVSVQEDGSILFETQNTKYKFDELP